jgi:hypothetical protein
MRSPLTRSRCSTDDRPAAICLMTILATLVVSPPALAQGDERVPPPLIERALRLPRAAPSDAAMTAATWLPELRLHAIVEQSTWLGHHGATTTILGELAWPLDRTPVGSAVDAARVRRQRAAARESLVERIATAWHERRRAEEAADDVAAELSREEADAELDALEDAP